MMKWRWYRSVIFWAGIFVMASLLWAWADSASRCVRLREGAWQAEQWAGGVAFSKLDPESVIWLASGKREISTTPASAMTYLLDLLDPEDAAATQRELVSIRCARPGRYRFIPGRSLQGAWDEVVLTKATMDPALYCHVLREYRRATGPNHVLGDGETTARGWTVFVPHWVLLASFAGLWFLVLLWRSKWKAVG